LKLELNFNNIWFNNPVSVVLHKLGPARFSWKTGIS